MGARRSQQRVHYKRRHRVYVSPAESVSPEPVPDATHADRRSDAFRIVRDINPQWEEDHSWIVEYKGKPGDQYQGRVAFTRRQTLEGAIIHLNETLSALRYWDARIKNLYTHEELPIDLFLAEYQ